LEADEPAPEVPSVSLAWPLLRLEDEPGAESVLESLFQVLESLLEDMLESLFHVAEFMFIVSELEPRGLLWSVDLKLGEWLGLLGSYLSRELGL